MKIAVSAMGNGLEAAFSERFGRCTTYVFVESDTLSCYSQENVAQQVSGGAGIEAADQVIGEGANAIVTGAIGPNAHKLLASANIPVYIFSGGTVRDAVDAFSSGKLRPSEGYTAPAHSGMGGAGAGRGQGGRGRGGHGPGGAGLGRQ